MLLGLAGIVLMRAACRALSALRVVGNFVNRNFVNHVTESPKERWVSSPEGLGTTNRVLADQVFAHHRLNRYWPLTFPKIVAIIIAWFPTFLFGQTCVPHTDLIKISDSELQEVVPCDFIGAAYLIGLGIGLNGYDGSADSGDYSYYPPLRYYLDVAQKENGAQSIDATAFLLVSSQVLAAIEDEKRDSRYYAYQAFTLGAFWKSNDSSVVSSRKLLADSFTVLLSLSGLSNYKELRCFIIADIPTISVEAIKLSDRYLLCRNGD
jgi:hypothetical protein